VCWKERRKEGTKRVKGESDDACIWVRKIRQKKGTFAANPTPLRSPTHPLKKSHTWKPFLRTINFKLVSICASSFAVTFAVGSTVKSVITFSARSDFNEYSP
jgi:hypothetical protein